MSTKVNTSHNPAHPIGTCARYQEEMIYNVPRLGPNGGYVHKGTGRVECRFVTPKVGQGWKMLGKKVKLIAGDQYFWKVIPAHGWQDCTSSVGDFVEDHAEFCFRRRIEQPAPVDKDARILELETVLRDLVKANEDWNTAVLEIIGPRPLWNDSYLDAARKALENEKAVL